MALFKKTDDYKSELLKPTEPIVPTVVAMPPAEPLTIADLDETPPAPAAPDAPSLASDEAWEKMIVVNEASFPSFYNVPKRHEAPHDRYYYAWANTNALNMQYKIAVGWRIVPPSMCRSLGLNEYQIKEDCAKVMDMVLVYIPRRPLDEFRRRVEEQEIRNPLEAPAVQQFLDMSSKSHGITTFGGPAEEIAARNKWRLDRPIRVGYTGRGQR